MIEPDIKVMNIVYTDIGVVKKMMGWSWADMAAYIGVEKSYFRQKYNGYTSFTKTDRALVWTLMLIAINK
jgi:hypothetical protein